MPRTQCVWPVHMMPNGTVTRTDCPGAMIRGATVMMSSQLSTPGRPGGAGGGPATSYSEGQLQNFPEPPAGSCSRARPRCASGQLPQLCGQCSMANVSPQRPRAATSAQLLTHTMPSLLAVSWTNHGAMSSQAPCTAEAAWPDAAWRSTKARLRIQMKIIKGSLSAGCVSSIHTLIR